MTTNVDRFAYHAGASGTVTIPAGQYVTGFAAHASGSSATLQITAQGEDTPAESAGDSIPIPAGTGVSVGAPVLRGDRNELGPGTVLVFTNTDMYLVVCVQFQPSN